MSRCEGWESRAHKTEGPVAMVYLHGCPYCGGMDCGDCGDAIYLCPSCLAELQADPTQEGRYTVLDDDA